MLTQINPNAQANDMDMTKQIASLRNQIAQLRDSVEDELACIRYDQLEANLRKKIDSIQELYGNVETTNIVAQTLKAKYLVADEIATQYATIKNLDAAVARIGTIEANYVSASYLSANYATIGSLSAVSARVGAIEADYVTAGVVAANYATIGSLNAVSAKVNTISANYITANDITASLIAGKFPSVNNGLTINTETLRASNIQRFTGDGYHSLVSTSLNLDGTTRKFATWT